MADYKEISKREAFKTNIANFIAKEEDILINVLMNNLQDKSRTTIKSYLSHNQVLVDNQITTKFDYPVKIGSKIVVGKFSIHEDFRHPKLRIIYEDDHLIVIDKKEGLLSIASETEKRQTAYSILSSYVKKDHPQNKIFVIHRLDRDTSGLMMFAKDEKTQSIMQKNWQEAIIKRQYIALVEGNVTPDKNTITSWLKENKALIVYSSDKPNDGKLAITNYEKIRSNQQYSLLKVSLDTGRKNQIRVHMQSIKYPIVGDKKYGSLINPIRRMGLHAQTLAFSHPYTKKDMFFESPIPKTFFMVFKGND